VGSSAEEDRSALRATGSSSKIVSDGVRKEAISFIATRSPAANWGRSTLKVPSGGHLLGRTVGTMAELSGSFSLNV